MNEEEIKKWVEIHHAEKMSQSEIAKAIVIEMIEKSCINENTYPGLKELMIKSVLTENKMVSCKNCRYYDGPGHMHWCRKGYGNHEENWFCADGKKKLDSNLK